MQRLKLTVNAEKTRCCRVPEESIEFLGYRIGRNYRRDTGRAYIGTRPSQASVQRICRRVSEATATRYGLLEPEVIVGRLNRLITGWANYFCLGQVSPAYAAVDRHTTRRLRRWLCRKHKARSGRHVRFSDTKLWEEHKLARLGPRTVSFPWAKARSRPRAQCGKSARWVRRAATGNGAMAWTEAPALAKAAGNSYSPRPTATAPVVDSTSNNCWDTSVFLSLVR